MKSTSALIKLGVFILITVVLTGVLASTIANTSNKSANTYKADFTDVTGVSTGDDVRIAGVKVGTVSGIKVVDKTLAELTFSAAKTSPLQTTTKAKIRFRNLVGQRYLELDKGDQEGGPLKAGEVLPVAQTTPALDLTQLFNGFKPLFVSLEPADVNRLSFEIVKTLQGEGGTLQSLLANTASLTTTIAAKDQVVGDVVTRLNDVLTTVAQHDSGLSDLIIQLQRVVTNLAQDRGAIGDSLQNIGNVAQATEQLLREANPSLTSDIQQLDDLAGKLEAGNPKTNQELNILPGKINQIVRTATYGSWFNFFLCSVDGQVRVNGQVIPIPTYTADTPQCRS